MTHARTALNWLVRNGWLIIAALTAYRAINFVPDPARQRIELAFVALLAGILWMTERDLRIVRAERDTLWSIARDQQALLNDWASR